MAAPSAKQRAVTLKHEGMDDSVVGAVLGISADDVRSLLYDSDPDVELGAGGVVEVATRVLSDAETRALPSSELELVPDPGEGLMLVPLWGLLVSKFVGDYTNVNVPAASLFVGTDVIQMEPLGGFPGASNVWDLYALLGTAQQRALLVHPARFVLTEPDAVWGADGYATADQPRHVVSAALNISAWNDDGGDFEDGDPANELHVTVGYYVAVVP